MDPLTPEMKKAIITSKVISIGTLEGFYDVRLRSKISNDELKKSYEIGFLIGSEKKSHITKEEQADYEIKRMNYIMTLGYKSKMEKQKYNLKNLSKQDRKIFEAGVKKAYDDIIDNLNNKCPKIRIK